MFLPVGGRTTETNFKTSGGIYTMKTTMQATPSLKIRNNTEKAINRLKVRGLAS